jgi:hypothetical protein
MPHNVPGSRLVSTGLGHGTLLGSLLRSLLVTDHAKLSPGAREDQVQIHQQTQATTSGQNGTPGGIRTPDPQVRSPSQTP